MISLFAKKTNLRALLSTYLVVVAIVPLLVVSIFSAWILLKSIGEDVNSKNAQLAGSIAIDIDEFLDISERVFAQSADTLFDKDFISSKNADRYLTAMLQTHHFFESIRILDSKNLIQYAAPYNPSIIGLDISENELVRTSRLTPGIHWSDTFISPVTGQPTLTMGLYQDGRVILADVSLSRISEFAHKFVVGKTGFISVTDGKGTYIANPDQNKVAERKTDTQLNRQISMAGKSLPKYFIYRDENYLCAAALIKRNGWAVIANQPINEAYAVLNAISDTSIIVSVLTAIVTIGLSIWLAGSMAKNLNTLVKRTQSVAAGDYSPLIIPSRLIELNRLTENFNCMTSEIRSLISKMEEVEAAKRKFYQDTILSVTDGKLQICDDCDLEPYISDSEICVEVHAAEEVAAARRELETFCARVGMNKDDIGFFALAAGEAITNSIKHAGGGVVRAGVLSDQVWVATIDRGPGIESIVLPKAVLRKGFSTKPSLGIGYSIILDVADRILLKTNSEGTAVILFRKIAGSDPINLDDLPDIW